MSHRATCLDNAACETVFSKLKAENRPDTDYANQEDLIQAIEEWIDYYNHRRIQTKLGNLTPAIIPLRVTLEIIKVLFP